MCGPLTSGQVSPSTQQGVDEAGKEGSVESEHWGHRGQEGESHAWGVVGGKAFGVWVRGWGPALQDCSSPPALLEAGTGSYITPQEGTQGLTGLGGWEVVGRSRSEIRVCIWGGASWGGRRSS